MKEYLEFKIAELKQTFETESNLGHANVAEYILAQLSAYKNALIEWECYTVGNLKYNKYAKRLIEEWEQHGKIIIGLGWDDTASPWRLNDTVYCDRVIRLVKVAQEVGAFVVIFTSSNKDRYDQIYAHCALKGLKIDSINENPIELQWGNETKIYANIFLDDRAGLEEALSILEFATYTIRGQKHSVNEQTAGF